MRIDYLVVQKFTLPVQTDNLATVAESRINSHGPLLAYRRAHQQLPEVISENLYAFPVRLFLGFPDYLRAD